MQSVNRQGAQRDFVLVIPLALAFADIALRHSLMMEWSARQAVAWLLSLLLGCLVWWLVMRMLRHLSRRYPRMGVLTCIVLGSLAALWAAVGFVCFAVFEQYTTWSDLAFFFEEVKNVAGTAGLFTPWLTVPVLGAIVAGAVAVSFVLLIEAKKDEPKSSWRARSLVAVSLITLWWARLSLSNTETPSPPDANLLVSTGELVQYYVQRSKGAYRKAVRSNVPQFAPGEAPLNVVLIIQESLGRTRMSLYGHERPTTPRLEQWAREEPQSLIVFDRAVTNSGNTSVVVPMLLTGLPPSASLEALHSAPFLWQYAKALNYRTLLLSAQSFRYAAFNDYFLSTTPDVVFTADGDDIELVNGGGMDDRLFAKRVSSELDTAARDSHPFFAVLQYNATHHPILRLPPRRPEFAGEAQDRRYDNAVALLDQLLDDLRAQLKKLGVLDRTVIIMTSDHGENLGQHPRHRTQSYYEEVLAIPLFVYVPDALCQARPKHCERVRENRHTRVSNLDVPPTVLDALGVLERPELGLLLNAFSGKSLLSELPEKRVIYALNNTAARHWVNEGFALIRDDEKYMFSERGGHEYYNLSSDPREQHNRFPELRSPPEWIANAIARDASYESILKRHTARRDPLHNAVEAL